MQTISFYKDNRVATIELSPSVMEILGDDTDGFVDIIRNVDTVDVAILLKGESPNRTRISLRSKGTDVNAIANHFGGGGHKKAAGFTMTGTPFDVLNNLSKQIEAQMEKLEKTQEQ